MGGSCSTRGGGSAVGGSGSPDGSSLVAARLARRRPGGAAPRRLPRGARRDRAPAREWRRCQPEPPAAGARRATARGGAPAAVGPLDLEWHPPARGLQRRSRLPARRALRPVLRHARARRHDSSRVLRSSGRHLCVAQELGHAGRRSDARRRDLRVRRRDRGPVGAPRHLGGHRLPPVGAARRPWPRRRGALALGRARRDRVRAHGARRRPGGDPRHHGCGPRRRPRRTGPGRGALAAAREPRRARRRRRARTRRRAVAPRAGLHRALPAGRSDARLRELRLAPPPDPAPAPRPGGLRRLRVALRWLLRPAQPPRGERLRRPPPPRRARRARRPGVARPAPSPRAATLVRARGRRAPPRARRPHPARAAAPPHPPLRLAAPAGTQPDGGGPRRRRAVRLVGGRWHPPAG